MDIIEHVKDTESLKEIVARYENGLQMFGLKLDDFPEDIIKLLDDVADNQMRAKLHDLDELYLNEFYLQQKADNIQKELSAKKLKAEINDLKEKIKEVKSENFVLEKFIKENAEPKEDYKENIVLTQTRNEILKSKKKDLKLPSDININQIVDKVELLKKKEEDKNKPKTK